MNEPPPPPVFNDQPPPMRGGHGSQPRKKSLGAFRVTTTNINISPDSGLYRESAGMSRRNGGNMNSDTRRDGSDRRDHRDHRDAHRERRPADHA